jgi:phosphoribosylformimino-5-aminoimidazole carboxamide ribonucleotide (ProFAR) isomerase
MAFDVIPIVMVANGRVVAPPGAAGSVGRADTNPLRIGWRWRSQGFSRLHLVDLNQAHGHSAGAEAAVLGLSHIGLSIQVGGGILGPADAWPYLATGAEAVVVRRILGYPARWRHLVREVGPGRIVAAFDVLNGRLGPFGARRGESLWAAMDRAAELGIGRFLVTALVDAEGAWRLDWTVWSRLARLGYTVMAQGGVGGPDDLARLRDLGVAGAVVGRALYQGAVGRLMAT